MAKEAKLPHPQQSAVDSELIRHQLHLQTLQTIIELYKVSNKESSFHPTLESVIQNLIQPFLPQTPSQIQLQ